MPRRLSPQFQNDLVLTVKAASANGAINVVRLADEIRQRHVAENVALEDVVEALMLQAGGMGLPIEFGESLH